MPANEPREPIDFTAHRWLELGSAEMDEELANAFNQLLERVNDLEERVKTLEGANDGE